MHTKSLPIYNTMAGIERLCVFLEEGVWLHGCFVLTSFLNLWQTTCHDQSPGKLIEMKVIYRNVISELSFYLLGIIMS